MLMHCSAPLCKDRKGWIVIFDSWPKKIELKTFLNPKDGVEVHTALTSRIWKEDDGIVRIVSNEDTESTISTVKEELEIFKKLGGGKKILIIGDATGVVRMTKEARDFVSSEEAGKVVGKMAGLSHSTTGKLISNFVIKVHKPKVPTKMFSDVDTAIKWLKN